ncbi:DUF2867 domain-containing protein [Pelagibius sp. Alg239-R121]|uniref:DUF2867 domain-containing protein n=1 Tax=Pelagibius sp. Alg239-R121 TaxID=2993448 RepID=UPI0024A7847C|nr:DUF2867 domain-containing protein [Pelagibius sp. Alg239-R121]
MTVRKTKLPDDSGLRRFVEAGDFLDCYTVDTKQTELSIAEITQRIFIGAPRWVELLLALRDLGVRPFGLKTTARLPTDNSIRKSVQPGEAVSFFCVHSISDNEIIVGEDDKHLDFRISVFRASRNSSKISLATWVHTHNRLGRIYLRMILRFHVLIVNARLAALPRELA